MNKIEWPLFVFREDGVLELCETLEDAQREYEGVDVDQEVYVFYDFSGCPARPVFITPNKYSSFLGLFHSCTSGIFEFERDPELRIDSIDVAVLESSLLEDNKRFQSMDQVIKHLESRGCSMKRTHQRLEKEAESGGEQPATRPESE